ncbi:hypothetical protein [Oscillatoria sp. FACHB-1407]|nr:hypothetical protein [Oscillatoria sp. FACHB-1407]
MQTKTHKIAGLSLGLVLIVSAIFPLIHTTAKAMAMAFVTSSEPKGIQTPPCRRPDGTRGPCNSPSPTPSGSPLPPLPRRSPQGDRQS